MVTTNAWGTRREVVTRQIQFVVPAPRATGCSFSHVMAAIQAAENELGTLQNASLPYGGIDVFPGDDEIIVQISWTAKNP